MDTDSVVALESHVKAGVASALDLAKLLHISSAKQGHKAVTVTAQFSAVLVITMTVSSKAHAASASPSVKRHPWALVKAGQRTQGQMDLMNNSCHCSVVSSISLHPILTPTCRARGRG